MNEASNGIIYISFGSLIEPKFANDLALKFVNLMKELPYRIIWKWDLAMIEDQVNDNFLIRHWLPQHDILSKYE